MTGKHRKRNLLLYQEYALITLLSTYLVVLVFGIYEALSTGGSALFFLINHFMVVETVNPAVYWIHLAMCVVIFFMLLKVIPGKWREIKKLKAKP